MSFLLIILVLYIHSGFHEIPSEISGMSFNIFLQKAISGMGGRLAVPLFFMISGYLFFLNTDGGIKSVVVKMRKRVRTLLIPYIIGCLFVPLFWVVMEQIPFAARFCNGQNVSELLLGMPWNDLLSTLFYKSVDCNTPFAFQLWFLRDLIIIVAISPALYYVRKLHGGVILAVFLLLFGLSLLDLPFVPIQPIFWFLLGSMMLNRMSYKNVLIPISYVLLSVLEIMYPNRYVWILFDLPIKFIGIWSLWIIYDWLIHPSFLLKDHKLLTVVFQFTFFIYLFHEQH